MNINLRSVMTAIACAILLIWTLFPIWWTISTAFKSVLDLREWPPSLIPLNPTLENFEYTWLKQTENIGYFVNSMVAAIGSTALALLFSMPAAYAAARFNFKGKSDILFTILSFRFLPPATVVIPLYMLGSYIGLIDTHIFLVFIYAGINIPLIVWVMMSYIREIPPELEESFMIDGYSRLQAFIKVTLPLSKSGLVAMGLLSLALSFGEFLFAGMLTSNTAMTFPVVLARASESPRALEWGRVASLAILGLAPLMIIFVLIRKHLARGLTFGAIK